jgi:hypothetical protein
MMAFGKPPTALDLVMGAMTRRLRSVREPRRAGVKRSDMGTPILVAMNK